MRRAWQAFGLTALLLVGSLPVFAGGADEPAGMKQAIAGVQAERIRQDVKYLSSDELEGRGTGAPGGELAAQYIAKGFAAAGLEPAGDNGTYFQRFGMVGIRTLPESSIAVTTPKRTLDLKLLDDVVFFNLDHRDKVDLESDVIFMGYGITAPEFGWDDYAGVDVKGKILLMLVNEPPSDDPKYFAGKALTYYGRWTYKYEQAARMGAAGVLLIHKTEMASYGWQVVRSSWSGENSSLAEDSDPKLALAGWVHLEKARAILSDAGLDVDALITAAQKKGFRPMPLPLHVKAHLVSSIRHFEGANVIGKLTGSDPKLKDEAIFFTGHYDHLGIRMDGGKKLIYHGALDNGTGTAMMMEIARAMAAAPVKPKRTVYIVSVTAEEQGLWGSYYLVKHPPVAPSKISLDLNYDAVAPLGIPKIVEAAGSERTDFDGVLEQTASAMHLKLQPAQHLENGGYYRSDHFSFARLGVPAFSLSPGGDFRGHSKKWVHEHAEQMWHHYHQPEDVYSDEDDYRCNQKLAQLGIALAYRAGELAAPVQWKPGEEFERARKASQHQ